MGNTKVIMMMRKVDIEKVQVLKEKLCQLLKNIVMLKRFN